MSFAVTRAYMRGRLMFIMTGFLLAVMIGATIIYWLAGDARTNVKVGAVIGVMGEATSDVIYHALMLDQTRLKGELAEERQQARTRDIELGLATAPSRSAAAQSIDTDAVTEAVRGDLRDAINRLERAYHAFGFAADGDIQMGESERITDGSEIAAERSTDALQAVLDDIRGVTVPASLMRIWEGENGNTPLKRDVLEVITLADRLDIFSDYSLPAAQRVFAQLQTLAKDRVRPNIEATDAELRADMLEGYDRLQGVMLVVAATIFLVGITTTMWVFVPMMRNIAKAHDDLQEANESIEAARIKAESADRAKSEFLANMSHEIRTPMNGVLGMAELLMRTTLDGRQKTFADVILKSGNALLTIINDILDFSKIDAGQLSLDPAPFRLAEAIEDVATLVSTRVAEKDLELIVRVDPELPACVVGDVGRIRQIVTNLVGNGVKFTEKGHVLVDVSGHVEDAVAQLTVRVEDTGIGIPEDMQAKVFEKFSQVDASSTRRHEGTGLGLAIASRLVDLMGGEMGMSSTPGRGSTFWFTVPLPVHEDFRPAKPVPVDVTGARVLVIDDNRVNRDILLEQLRSWHFDCAATENGEIGLAFLDRAVELGAKVDCIILDYQMPGINGLEVARRIAANPATWNIPVLLLTSVDQAITGKLTMESGIAAHLNKPARSSALLETLVTLMQTARSAPRHARATPVPRPAPKPVSNLAPQAPQQVVRKSAVRQLDILVAEDNEVNQLVFSQILDSLNLNYRIASNGRIAVELQRQFKPRLILMDVSMPDMNGFEATAAIRHAEEGTGQRTPIIGVTAHALKGDREKCIESGMDDYLSKPVSPNKLAAKINAWMTEDKVALSA
ncbi:response regulator [Mesorhizobium sp. CAU 1741]|uniref:response regulator n=1 Tax=Mesorhizobium sp. CAU 1741 TaxID=3140366 RepID=UPI00325B6462